MNILKIKKFIHFSFFTFSLFIFPCTDIEIKTDSDDILHARTLDFVPKANPYFKYFKKNKKFNSTNPAGEKTFNSINKYSYLNIICFDDEKLSPQGINEEGLYVALLWLPANTKYTNPDEIKNNKNVIEISDFINYILGNFKNIDEVENAINNILIWSKKYKALADNVPTVQALVSDKNGNSLIMEYNEKPIIYKNYIGVITNSPTYAWHIDNISNYLSLTKSSTKSLEIFGKEFKQTSFGNGFIGMPGGFTSPNRFIRSLFLKMYSDKPKDLKDGISLANNLIGNVTLPKGIDKDGDYTQWTTITDLSNLVIYFKEYNEINYKKLNLKELFNKNKDFIKKFCDL